MDFDYSPKVQELQARLQQFMDEHVYPNEERFDAEVAEGDRWQPTRVVEELKAKAQGRGAVEPVPAGVRARRRADQPRIRAAVRNHGARAAGRPRSSIARRPTPATWKCWSATARRSRRSSGWSRCSTGEIRSAFAMTEPAVASSDATNIQSSIVRDGDEYVINGRKWWSSGARRSALQDLHLHGQDRSRQRRQAHAAVDDPGAARYAGRERSCATCRCSATTTRRTATWKSSSRTCGCRSSNILLGEGRGFEIAQGRLGPGPHPSLHAR